MDSEVLFVLAVVGFFIIAPIVALVQSCSARRRISELEERVDALQQWVLMLRSQTPGQPTETRVVEEAVPTAPTPPAPEMPEEETDVEPEPSWRQAIPKFHHDEPRITPSWATNIAPPAGPEVPPAPSVPPATPVPPMSTGREEDWLINTPPPTPPSRPRQPVSPQPQPARTTNWEVMIGGNIFNRIGALAIIITMGFLLSYAYQQRWITKEMVAGLGFVAGIVLNLLGNRFGRRNMEVFAQGLIGAGISILYLSTYAVYRYDYLSQPVALLMMSVVTSVAVVQSVKNNSLVVSLLGLVGGFLTPVLLSNGAVPGSGASVGLFAYIALLDLGLLAVVVKKDDWAILEPLAFAATCMTYIIWRSDSSVTVNLGIIIPFLTIFWALFFAMDVYRIVKSIKTFSELRMVMATINAVLFYTALYYDLYAQHPNWMGFATLLLATVFFVSVFVMIKRRIDNLSVVPRYLVISVLLLVLATGLQFRHNAFLVATLWSVEGFVLVWLGLRNNMKLVYVSGMCLFAAALVAIITEPNAFLFHSKFILIANFRFLAYSVLAATLAASAYLFGRSEDAEMRDMSAALHIGWFAVIFGLIGIETNDYFSKLIAVNASGTFETYFTTLKYGVMACIWLLYSVPLMLYGATKQKELFRGLGIFALATGIAVAAVQSVVFQPIHNFHLLFNVRAGILALAIITTLFAERLSRRYPSQSQPELSQILIFAAAAVGFELLTVETSDYFLKLLSVNHSQLLFGAYLNSAKYLVMSAVWMLYSLFLMWLGGRRQSAVLMGLGTASLVAGVVLAAAQSVGFGPVAGFHLLLNARVAILLFTIAVIMLAERFVRRYPSLWLTQTSNVMILAAGLVGFELLTVETLDYFAHVAKSLNANAFYVSGQHMTQNLVLACVWLIYSLFLTWYGARKRSSLTVISGFGALTLGLVTIAIQGFEFVPIERFHLLLNVRAGAFVLAALVLLIYRQWLGSRLSEYPASQTVLKALPIVSSILIFELISVETWDFFSTLIGTPGKWESISNLRQMTLSVVWLVYSIILVAYGMWRRYVPVRVVAMGLFMITILKVFLSDLSFLDTLYRIFSFLGLGLILLATSYLYQRYRSIILDTEAEAAAEAE